MSAAEQMAGPDFTSWPSRPDQIAGPAAYGTDAGDYDHRTALFQYWRQRLVSQLTVQHDDIVLDVGCGTGLCLGLLQDRVGHRGSIIGIDESEDMLRLATERVARHRWSNVRLITAPVDRACIEVTADAALFCAVHDILQSPEALAHIFSRLRPGASVAAIGGKWPAPWMWPLRAWVADLHAPFVADFTGFDRPWQLLSKFVPDLQVDQLAFGTGYLAYGRTPIV